MKRLIISIILVIAALLVAFSFSLICKQRERKSAIAELPNAELIQLDSTTINTQDLVKDKKTLLILYFHPECELCALEIGELLKNKDYFENIRILFVSFASVEEIKEFIVNFPIDEFADVTIASDYKGHFADKFHVKSIPLCFIYKSRKFEKSFRGMIKIKDIQKYL